MTDAFAVALAVIAGLSLLPLAWDLASTALAYLPRRRGPTITVKCSCGSRFVFRFTRTGEDAPGNDFMQRHLAIHRSICPDVP